MATTNWERAEQLQYKAPRTFGSMQAFVMSLADLARYVGKKHIFFGRNKEKNAYAKFENNLRVLLLIMRMENIISEDTSTPDVRAELIRLISAFAEAFPNWQDAYAAADGIFVHSAESAEELIGRLRS